MWQHGRKITLKDWAGSDVFVEYSYLPERPMKWGATMADSEPAEGAEIDIARCEYRDGTQFDPDPELYERWEERIHEHEDDEAESALAAHEDRMVDEYRERIHYGEES